METSDFEISTLGKTLEPMNGFATATRSADLQSIINFQTLQSTFSKQSIAPIGFSSSTCLPRANPNTFPPSGATGHIFPAATNSCSNALLNAVYSVLTTPRAFSSLSSPLTMTFASVPSSFLLPTSHGVPSSNLFPSVSAIPAQLSIPEMLQVSGATVFETSTRTSDTDGIPDFSTLTKRKIGKDSEHDVLHKVRRTTAADTSSSTPSNASDSIKPKTLTRTEKKVCRHGLLTGQCTECRAASVCEHNRRRSRCKDCGGSGICSHGRQRNYCKECGGSGICEHNRKRSLCKDCGGSSICVHGRQRSRCRDCGGSQICEHNRRRSLCKECGGSQICVHQRQRSLCKDCGGSQICVHKRRKRQCKECAALRRQAPAMATVKEEQGDAVTEGGETTLAAVECKAESR